MIGPVEQLYTYAYPDVMVVAHPFELQTGRTDTVMNPCLIAEVLSTSTKAYDRGDRFLAYRTGPTFQEYLLVDQYSIYVEHHVKTSPNQWLMSEYRSADTDLSMNSVDCRISIADLYEGTILGRD